MEKHPELPDELTMLKVVQEQYQRYLQIRDLSRLPTKEEKRETYLAPTPESPLTSNSSSTK